MLLSTTRPYLSHNRIPSHMGITAINSERGDVDRIIDVLKEVILEATSKR
jgi:hypothetical protein